MRRFFTSVIQAILPISVTIGLLKAEPFIKGKSGHIIRLDLQPRHPGAKLGRPFKRRGDKIAAMPFAPHIAQGGDIEQAGHGAVLNAEHVGDGASTLLQNEHAPVGVDALQKLRKTRAEFFRPLMNGKGRIDEVADILQRSPIHGFQKIHRSQIRGHDDGFVLSFQPSPSR